MPLPLSGRSKPFGKGQSYLLSPRLLIAIVLALLPLIYFFPAVLGRVLLAPGDGWTQIFGLRVLIGQMLARGELPLWNPYIFAGMPLLASIQTGALYPPTWLFAVLSPKLAMNLMVITTYHVALVGTYLYARRIGVIRVGAMISGIAFAFGGFMVAHLGHTNRIAAAAWLPWILLAIEHLRVRASWRWVALGAAFIALQFFAGEPQVSCYTAIIAGAYFLFRCLGNSDNSDESRARFVAAIVAVVVIGALLSMAAVLPEREMLKQGARAAIDYEYFAQFSLPPRQALGLIIPYFFGGASLTPYRVGYWGEWNLTETCGYVGMLALLLAVVALVAMIGNRRSRLVWFWAACAVAALLLAFGSYLPFGIHHALYHVPIYKLFRASGRHLFEFTFALAVLAGLGLTSLIEMERAQRQRVLAMSCGVMGLIAAALVIIYRFDLQALAQRSRLPEGAGAITNYELLVPIISLVIGAAVLWAFARHPQSLIRSGALVIVILLDAMSWGAFYEWRTVRFDLDQKLADAPTVKLIKSREADLSSFRIYSRSLDPFGASSDLLDYPNTSIVRGLQSVNGYDPLLLGRLVGITGAMALDGQALESNLFGLDHRGLDLLNTKYLLSENSKPEVDRAEVNGVEGKAGKTQRLELDGIEFSDPPLNLQMGRGVKIQLPVNASDKLPASEVAIISGLGRAAQIEDGTPVVAIRLRTTDGRVIEQKLLAGRDTSDVSHDSESAQAKHERATIAETWQEHGDLKHYYLARLPFERARIESVEFEYLLKESDITITRATLFDAETKNSSPVRAPKLSPDRWRQLGEFGQAALYENLRVLPRAWFARRFAIAPSVDVLETIKTGHLPDGSPFDPRETVLLESEQFAKRAPTLPAGDLNDAQVEVISYRPNRIELKARNAQAGFLVLSEMYYSGWRALIDGQPAPVERVDYTLRGVIVPAGDHRITFDFNPPSFRNGLICALLGVVLLLAGIGASRSGLSQSLAARAGRALSGARLRISSHQWLTIIGGAALVVYACLLISHAAYGVGGADSSGYGRSAQSLVRGRVAEPIQELARLGLPASFSHLFVPIGSTEGPRPGTIVSFYPVGLPLHLALAALLGGWSSGPFLVSPLAATLSLLLIYLLGRELGLSRPLATAGAVVLGMAPPVIFIGQQPVSDVLAMFWTLVTVWAALRVRRDDHWRDRWAMLAGAAFGIGFLVRPLNLLILLPVLLALPWNPRAWLRFVLGGLPLALVFCVYNYAAFGHPLQTGYGAIKLHGLITTRGAAARSWDYIYWLTMMFSPLLLVGWLGVAVDVSRGWRDRALLLVWFGAFLIFYSCYDFQSGWVDTRFLLPGLPGLIIGALLAGRDGVELFNRRLNLKERTRTRGKIGAVWLAIQLVIPLIVVVGYEMVQGRRLDVWSSGAGEMVYRDSCRAADRLLPERALIVSGEMSGALKFYTQRSIIRWNEVNAGQWPILKASATRTGYRWYALLAAHETEIVQQQVPGQWREIGNLRGVSLWQIEQGKE